MKRQIKNLLFLYCFIIALFVGRTNYVQFGRSLLADVHSKLSKPYIKGNLIAEQNNYNKVLPTEAFISAHQSFMEGKYFNKSFGAKEAGAPVSHNSPRLNPPATNYGRDGP